MNIDLLLNTFVRKLFLHRLRAYKAFFHSIIQKFIDYLNIDIDVAGIHF